MDASGLTCAEPTENVILRCTDPLAFCRDGWYPLDVCMGEISIHGAMPFIRDEVVIPDGGWP